MRAEDFGVTGSRMKYAAMLRGVNVGGKNLLPMKELAGLFTAAGCSGVRTYIQSGNVLFEASPAVAGRVSKSVPKTIEERFGFRSPVVLRSAAELDEAIANNPYPVEFTHVAFLLDAPAVNAELDGERFAPDQFLVRGRDVYLHLPNGVGRSKLTNAYFDRALGTVSTMRNWRTVLKLREMLG